MIRAALFTGLCGALALQSAQQPPRDTRPRSEAVATGEISGTVTSDEPQTRKLRRVRVTLNGAALPRGGQTVITDDDGRFSFAALPPGEYGLLAVKDGYVSARYRSARPVWSVSYGSLPSTGVFVRPGAHLTADIRLLPGAVVTGIVTDLEGRPEEGVIVTVSSSRQAGSNGVRHMDGMTDDRGSYRVFGLPPGEYVIAARKIGADSPQQSNLKLSTDENRRVLPVPVYFPSTTDVTAATRIRLASGDERSGLDIQMSYVPAATVAGVATFSADTISGRVALGRETGQPGVTEFVAMVNTEPGGAFTLTGVAPGRYTLHAVAQGAPTSGSPLVTTLATGSLEIDVEDDLTAITIPMSQTFSISGRIVLEGAAPATLRLGRSALPIAPARGFMIPPSYFQPLDESRFTLSGLISGAYRVRGTVVPGTRTPMGKWWLKSILISGLEALDEPLATLRPNDDVVVTLSDQASTVSGVVRDTDGAAIPGVFVAIFGTDRASWFVTSRRVAVVRTAAQGRYTIRNLPPGDYRAAVALDLEPNDWFDPDVLETLVPNAVPLTIAAAETKPLDLLFR